MKLPSLRQTLQEARATLKRFPVVLAASVIGTVAALVLVEYEGPAGPTLLFPVLLASILAIPLLLALGLMAERRGLANPAALGLQLLGVLLLTGYAFTVPMDLTHAPNVYVFRFMLLAVALHLFVAVAPFTRRGEVNGFWHYNKALLLRLLTALLYSAVLFAGLAIALAALDNLFGVDVPGKRYFELWVLIAGVFNTWFFLAGVPEDLTRLDGVSDYPKGLKVFAQYILLPIVVVYLVILYAYLGKVIVSWDWPQGWVSKLILGFSGTGLFTLLLLHPLTGREGNAWVTKAARWFYLVLIPLVVMLFLAVWRRVSEYGITEGRYLAVATGVWLAFLVLYFTLSRAKSIKVIPASLCLLALLVSFGPWGAFSVSEKSQVARLKTLAGRAGILADGKVMTGHGEVVFQDAKQISAILSYLHEVHGLNGIQQWFAESLVDESITSGVASKQPEAVAKMMGFEYVQRWRDAEGGFVSMDAESGFNVAGYDRMVQLPMFAPAGEARELPGAAATYRFTGGMDTLTFNAAPGGEELFRIDMRKHAEELTKELAASSTGRIPDEKMAVSAAGGGLRVKLCPWQIRADHSTGTVKIQHVRGVLLYSTDGP